jgi:hypothetical protein
MTNVPACDNQTPAEGSCAAVPAHAIVMLVAGVAAAWFAAGSAGLLTHSLQHALTWLTLVVAIVAAWPEDVRRFGTWAVLAVGVVLGAIFTALAIPAVNVLAVAVVLASIAQIHRGLTARVALIAAIGVTVLACYRFAYTSIPSVWLAADGLGWVLGRAAGWLAGSPLDVGATFGGIDFLVLTVAIYIGWVVCTVRPRCSRVFWGAAAIIVGHFAYLLVLAYSEKLLAALPAFVPAPKSDTHRVGLSVWTNGLRSLLPWSVPLLALVIDAVIVASMAACSRWIPVVDVDPETLKRQKAREEKEELPGSVLLKGLAFQFGPVVLAVAAILFGSLMVNRSDLQEKKIVAYDKGYLDWVKPEHDSTSDGMYGMLPVFVESLGGRFIKSKELSAEDLASADVLLLIHPDQPWPKETLQRVRDYVRGGGSLLLVADPAIHEGNRSSSFNDVLEPLSMSVRFDTAITRTGNWEQSYEIMSHPATAGLDDLRNRFGMQSGSTIRTSWLARPTLVGQWGWSEPGNDAATTGVSQYNTGERLGDLVLAAEQPLGQGRVFVLGDTSPLRNDGLPNAFPFVGRLLSYLAHRPSSPQVLWRQLCTLATLLATLGLLVGRPAAWQVMLTSTVMAVALACCTFAAYWSGRVLPDGRHVSAAVRNPIAYVDASHLEAYDSDSRSHGVENHGISEFLRTLMRQGYLPLLTPDLAPDRLEGCGLLVLIAPSQQFTPEERASVKKLVDDGGLLLCIVGAEEARPSARLLEEFNFRVPPSPVKPDESTREPEPFGCKPALMHKDCNRQYMYYAAWPVECTATDDVTLLKIWPKDEAERPTIICRMGPRGRVVVIGDTYFATNENLYRYHRGDVVFDRSCVWRWLFSQVIPGEKEWIPPNVTPAEMSANAVEEDEGDEEGME